MLFSVNSRPDGIIIFGRSVSHLELLENKPPLFSIIFTCTVVPAAHLGTVGYPFGYPIQPFYIWKLPFLTESSLKKILHILVVCRVMTHTVVLITHTLDTTSRIE